MHIINLRLQLVWLCHKMTSICELGGFALHTLLRLDSSDCGGNLWQEHSVTCHVLLCPQCLYSHIYMHLHNHVMS